MSLLGELDYVLLSQARTSFAGIIPDITIEEVPRDALVITQHPVEKGAAISDHAYRLPVILEMRLGFSNATAGAQGYTDERYETLRGLQAQREPFDVFTPRRLYSNMLLRGLVAPRDDKTGDTLFIAAIFEEVILTFTQQASGSSASSENQAMPSSTGSVSEGGTTQPGDGQGLENFGGTISGATGDHPAALDGLSSSPTLGGIGSDATVGGLAGDQPIGLGGLSGAPGADVTVGEIQMVPNFQDGTTWTPPSGGGPTDFSLPNPDGYMNQ